MNAATRRRILAICFGTGILAVLALAKSFVGAQPDEKKAAAPKFVAVDTSRLMLQPDRHDVYGVEDTFPGLRFERPVYLASPRDGTDRIFVAEQDGVIRVFPNQLDARDYFTTV